MTIAKAVKFVKQAGFDKELRKSCYNSKSKKELLKRLNFNEEEFEDAINMQLVKCQTFEQAALVQQLKMWFLLL